MSFRDDVIANFIRNLRTRFGLSSVSGDIGTGVGITAATTFVGTVLGGLDPSHVLLLTSQAFLSFVNGSSSGKPGDIVNAAGSVVVTTALYFAEYELGAVVGGVLLGPVVAVGAPFVLGILAGAALQAVYDADVANVYNHGFGPVLTTVDEGKALTALTIQYGSDTQAASDGGGQPAETSFYIPGNVLTINLDSATWASTFSNNPLGGLDSQGYIIGRSNLVGSIIESILTTSPASIESTILATIDPYLTQIEVANLASQVLSDTTTAVAFQQSIGEVLELGNESGTTFAPTGQSLDIMIARGVSNTLDFTSTDPNGSGFNLLELVGGGALNIRRAANGNSTFVYDPTSSAMINLSSPAGTSVNLYEIDCPDITSTNFLLMNAANLANNWGGGVFLVNPTRGETILWNGVKINSPQITQVPNPLYNPQYPTDPPTPPTITGASAGGFGYTYGNYLGSSSGADASFLSVTGGSDGSGLTVWGFKQGDFGINLPEFTTTGLFGRTLTESVGTAPRYNFNAAAYLTTATKPVWDNQISPTVFGGTSTGRVENVSGLLQAHGQITTSNASDLLGWLSGLVAVEPAALATADGNFTFDDATGNWTFTLDRYSPHFLSLANGVISVDKLVVNTLDGSSEAISVQVVGDGPAPRIPFSILEYQSSKSQIDSLGVGIEVVDNSANISSALDSLNADANIVSITFTDSAVPKLRLTVAQLLRDTRAIGDITNSNYVIDIVDTAANIGDQLNVLNSNSRIESIAFTDPGLAVVGLSVEAAVADYQAISKFVGAYQISIRDTAANIAGITIAQAADLEFAGYSTIAALSPVTLSVREAYILQSDGISIVSSPVSVIANPDLGGVASFQPGSAGAYNIVGGSGLTTLDYSNLQGSIDAHFDLGPAWINKPSGLHDTATGIEVLIGSGQGDTIVTHVGQSLEIHEASGNNRIYSNGTDTIFTGSGNDIVSLQEASTIYGGSGHATVIGASNSQGFSYYGGIGSDYVYGSASGNDLFFGGTGTGIDRYYLGHGADVVHVESETSYVYGGVLGETYDYSGVKTAVVANFTAGGTATVSKGNSTADYLTGASSFVGTGLGDTITVGAGASLNITESGSTRIFMSGSGHITLGAGTATVTGSSSTGAETIIGGSGTDYLAAGAGPATLEATVGIGARTTLVGGGAGSAADVFYLSSADIAANAGNYDYVYNYRAGFDTLDLSLASSGHVSFTQAGSNTFLFDAATHWGAYVIGVNAATVANTVTYSGAGGNTI